MRSRMEGSVSQNAVYPGATSSVNNDLAQQVIEEAIRRGVREFCVAPGARCAPLVYPLARTDQVKVYYWPEERSAAFFALGRIKATERPVAVVTTSGTAAAELLPAAMNAHYLELPLLMITADRPRRFRGTGAPQTAEQVGLFGCYAHFEQDVAPNETCSLHNWSYRGAAHLNVCFEEPKDVECNLIQIQDHLQSHFVVEPREMTQEHLQPFHTFLQQTRFPLVVVGGLHPNHRELAVEFLLNLNAPIYAEGFSGLREDTRLAHLRITRLDQIWQMAEQNGYPIDGVLRLGEIPTARLWRDLEEKEGRVRVCSVSDLPFSGLSWANVICTSLSDFFIQASEELPVTSYPCQKWLQTDRAFQQALHHLFKEEPEAEPSLFHTLSLQLPDRAKVYLGNSLPIREWDLAATFENKHHQVSASRGVNGIDGQISTFLGLSTPHSHNWAILGDLTAVYDMAGPWVLSQLAADTQINLIVVNNRGGQIFSRMFSLNQFPNPHDLDFEHLAAFWRMHYELWHSIPRTIERCEKHRLVEIVPDARSTDRFWKKMSQL